MEQYEVVNPVTRCAMGLVMASLDRDLAGECLRFPAVAQRYVGVDASLPAKFQHPICNYIALYACPTLELVRIDR